MASAAVAQQKNTISITSFPSIRDTVILTPKDKNQLPYNGMPNAVITKPLPPAYIGNNGKGFDMYESRVDNMGILKPDNSFASNMPVAKMQKENNLALSPGNTIPRNKLNDLLEKIRKSDSLFMKPAKPKIYHYPKK